MKKIYSIAIKLFTYGLLIPLIVFLLADLTVRTSCKCYWGEWYLHHITGVKLVFWVFGLFCLLTIIYYIFCTIFFLVWGKQNLKFRIFLTAVFIIIPIVFYDLTSHYDYRITICFALFHLTFYILFFAFRYFFTLISKKPHKFNKQ